jgi:hypothetical protein
MVIARMLLRGALLTLAFTSAMATARVICRIMRLPSLRHAEQKAIRASTQPIRLEVEAPVPSPAILRASPCVNRQNLLWRDFADRH